MIPAPRWVDGLQTDSRQPARTMSACSDLTRLLVAIAAIDHRAAAGLLDATPSLATARMARRDEFFLADRLAQVYEGDTALHAAAFSYDAEMARELVQARRRRAGAKSKGCRTSSRRGDRRAGVAELEPGAPAGRHRLSRRSGRRPERAGRRRGDAAASSRAQPVLGGGRGPPWSGSRSSTSRTIEDPPRPTSIIGRPDAVAPAPRRPRPNNGSSPSCSGSTR